MFCFYSYQFYLCNPIKVLDVTVAEANTTPSITINQFVLPDNLQLLNVSGGRAEELFSDLHHNPKGLILGFSMSANKIPKIQNYNEDALLLKIQVKTIDQSNTDFKIKSILAGANGQKLSFINTLSELTLESDIGEKKLIKISFYE